MSLHRFLIIDHNVDGRTLLVRTLARQFPGCVLRDTHDADQGLMLLRKERPSAVILHRTLEYDGPTLVALVRRLDLTLPIIAVSGRDDYRSALLAAGASAFLNYDAWLRIGATVAQFLGTPDSSPPWKVGDALGEAVST